MEKIAFRHYKSSASDFPLVIAVSTKSATLPDLSDVEFDFHDVSSGGTTAQILKFVSDAAQSASLTVPRPASSCDMMFTIQVAFPAASDEPLQVSFKPATGSALRNSIKPDDVPIVFGNYVIQFRA